MHSKLFKAFLIFISAITLLTLHFNGFSSNDFWIQAAVGDHIWKNFSLPQTALYPFTIARDYPFLVHEWFASVIMSLIASWSGDSGLGYAVAKFSLAAILLSFAFRSIRLRGVSFNLALMLASIISIFLSFRLTLRAENLAFIFFAAFICLFHQFIQLQEQFRQRTTLGWLFLLTMVWANTHGSFVVGFAYVGIYFFSLLLQKNLLANKDSLQRIGYLLGFMLLASLLNPYGYEIFESAAHISTSTYMKTFIAEWQPPFSSGFSKTPSFYFYVCYLVASLLIFLSHFRKISIFDRSVYLAFAVLSLLALRHMVYFYLASLPLIAAILNSYKPAVVKKITLGLATLLVFSFAFVITAGNYIQIKVGTEFEAPLDLDSIKWIRKQNYKGAVFNSYTLGDQLAYNFYPDMRIVIDSRTDLYGEDYLKRYHQTIFQDAEFLNFLSGNQIKLMVISSEDFYVYMQKSPNRLAQLQAAGWKIGFQSRYNFILSLDKL